MICPRCEGDQAYIVHEADDGTWEIYRCPRCNFNWRSAEEVAVTDAKMYDPMFKLTEKKIEEMDPKPPIPPLRK